MRRRLPPLVLPCALALLALAAGCDSNSTRSPRTTQTVVLSPDQKEQEAKIQAVTAIRVVLPGPEAGTGLVWEIGSNNGRVLYQMGPLKTVPAQAAAGSAATTTVSFYALNPGRSVIRFFLVRPNLAEAVPEAACTLAVLVEE